MSCAPARLVASLVAFACTALVGLAVASADPVSIDPLAGDANKQSQELADGVARFRNGDVDGALKLFKQAAEKNPDLPPGQFVMATLLFQANRAPDARIWLERTVLEVPSDPQAYALMGEIAIRERRVTEANMLFDKAEECLKSFDKSDKRKKVLTQLVLSGQAAVAELRGEWETAQKYLEAWLAQEPESANAMQRLGQALFQLKKYDLALKQLMAAAKLDSNMLTPEAIMASWYESTGDHDNAVKMMEAALKSHPDDLRTRLAAASWALQTQQFDQALDQANSALQLDPNSLEAKILRGNVAMYAKDFKTAELQFESAALQSPFNFAATNNLAVALAEQNDEAKLRRASEYAQVNVQRYPKQPEAHSTLGWVLFKQKRFDEAERSLRLAVSTGTTTADTAYYLACVDNEKGLKSEARKLLQDALDAKGPFTYRAEAQGLLEKVKQELERPSK